MSGCARVGALGRAPRPDLSTPTPKRRWWSRSTGAGGGARGVPSPATLFDLERTIRQRREADPDQSYVARLTARGRAKIAQKVGEEAVETVIAAMASDRDGAIGESADLLFHLLVLLADLDISLDDVLDELDRREGVSGIAEKASRTAD